uniref:Uncharacterized protein n=1 Tax=Lactuca sativa TaxID=4236 RepID=A0A9R1W9J6_LACSA|nr:hypothetical protein LSAT_V11C200059960 [Lactuca sativa]
MYIYTYGRYASWKELFNIYQRVFATISTDHVQTNIKLGVTTQELWVRIEEIFQDNKATQFIYLEEEFNCNIPTLSALLKENWRASKLGSRGGFGSRGSLEVCFSWR